MKSPYFPFTEEPHKLQMGLKPLDLKEWIEIDSFHRIHIEEKAKLLKDHYKTVLQTRPEAEPACFELYQTLKEHLLNYHAEEFEIHKDRFLVKATGRFFSTAQNAQEALEQITCWVQEDWCVLSSQSPVRLMAGSVCFPSRWALSDKIGKDSEGIHGPVPKFKENIGKPTMNFLEKITVDRPMWRINWTLHDSDTLFCPGPHPGRQDLNLENVLEHTYLRMERQTLRRLPKTGAVIFTIRTYLEPMFDVIADPERRRLLGEAVRSLSDEMAEYKGMKDFHALLKQTL